MTAAPEGFLHFTSRKLREWEPSIPGLRERMIVRTLRMLLENCMTEMYTEESNGWEGMVGIFVEMRETIRSLSKFDNYRCNASRLCSAIGAGIEVEHPAFERLDAEDIISIYTTEAERIGFFVSLYEGVSRSLEALAGDAEFMRQFGNNSSYVFGEIISRVKMMAESGKTVIEQLLTGHELSG